MLFDHTLCYAFDDARFSPPLPVQALLAAEAAAAPAGSPRAKALAEVAAEAAMADDPPPAALLVSKAWLAFAGFSYYKHVSTHGSCWTITCWIPRMVGW